MKTMRVLIKGMDMPKSCDECDICADDFMWFHCPVGKQADGRVLDLENHKDEFIYTESRHPDCPLREIPIPHGRLIDANIAVIRITKAILKFNRDKYGDESYMHDKLYDILEQTIDSVPTIIEAEGENDKL